MSGGSLDYVYHDVRSALGSSTIDDDQAECVEDIVELLQDIEWSASGDYGSEVWREALDEFCEKWGDA